MNGLRQTLIASVFLLLAVAGSRACEAALVIPQSAVGVDGLSVDLELVGLASQATNPFDSTQLNGLQLPCVELIELSPLFPASSGPPENPNEPEVESVSSPLPGATALPPSATSIASSAGGWALASPGEILPASTLQVPLAGEGKIVLPAGPPYRWFRPPKKLAV